MTEDEARAWISARWPVSRETLLERFVELLRAESERQNLIARSTLDQVWARHIVDSAQLLSIADGQDGLWVDIGTGAGLPGIVIAILRDEPIVMVEPRRRRVEFLDHCIAELGLTHARTFLGKVEGVHLDQPVSVISARAVSALPELLAAAWPIARRKTLWVLPKGLTAQSEVAMTLPSWQGVFHVEPSITDPKSGIIIAREVKAR